MEDKVKNELTINLFSPGMTSLHKAGLAGLWMTLEALEKENGGKKAFDDGSGSWERNKTSVTLRWNDKPEAFFSTLLKYSFQTDHKTGLLWFPALGHPMEHDQYASILQEAVLGTILQHGRHRTSDPSKKPGGNLVFYFDDSPFPVKFHRIKWYKHQNETFYPTGMNPVAGWLFPGGAVRHFGLGEKTTTLEESPDKALALRYVIIGVIYFRINRFKYCLVLPEINNLERYAQARRVFMNYGVLDLESAGTADAAFRVLTEFESRGLLEDLYTPSCRVISFGVMPWSEQQKTRAGILDIHVSSKLDLQIFSICRQMFKTRFVKPDKGDPFWDIPQTPDLVARNLVSRRKWWEGFADALADKNNGEHILKYEKGGLAKMLENRGTFPDEPERTFVLACQEAWRRRMGQISEKAKREHSSFIDQVDREFTRTTIAFSRCKNAASFRETVTDFWARSGGALKPLQNGWHDILALMDEQNWRKGRDLALLALVSYSKEEDSKKEGGKQQ